MTEEKRNEILLKILEMKDVRKCTPEFLSFAEEDGELKEIISIIKSFEVKKDEMKASPEALKAILRKIPQEQSVTFQEENRYSYKGRIIETLNQIHNLMTKKLIIPVGVVVIVLVALILISGPKGERRSTFEDMQDTGNEVAVTVSGDVDEVVDSLLAAIDNESFALKDEEENATLLTSDSQAISDFGGIYNDNEL